MNPVLMLLLYFSVFLLLSLAGYRLYKILNNKIKEAQKGNALAGYSLLLFFTFALLLVLGLYVFIELYAFLAKPKA